MRHFLTNPPPGPPIPPVRTSYMEAPKDIVKALIYPVSVGFGDMILELRKDITFNETVEDVARSLGLEESFHWQKTCEKWYPVFGSGGNASTLASGGEGTGMEKFL